MNENTNDFFLLILEKPPSFACHRTKPFTQQGTITYTTCNVRNNGMNARTGKFTVQVNTNVLKCEKKFDSFSNIQLLLR